MKNLDELRSIKKEVLDMKFDYKNVHRILHLIYETKELLEDNSPIPNKDIAHQQTNKVIENEAMNLVKSSSENEIKESFSNLKEGLNLVLAYF